MKAKQVNSWGDIPQEKFEAFYEAVAKLREEMVPRDCDNDHPLELIIVNRMTHEPLNYLAVPRSEIYSYETHGYLRVHPDKQRELEMETERALTANVSMAASALERYQSLKYIHYRNDSERARPLADRIKEACPLCKKKVGFENHPHDFYAKTRENYPTFPLKYHVGAAPDSNYECKAFYLRRALWESEHPEYRGANPAPRWCMNPECRAKLADYNSRKGKKDKNICLNGRCRMDNSKFYPEASNV